MLLLILGLILFLGVHSTRLFAPEWRAKHIAAKGLMTWKGLYALVSIIGFVLLFIALVLLRTRTEIAKRRVDAILKRKARG